MQNNKAKYAVFASNKQLETTLSIITYVVLGMVLLQQYFVNYDNTYCWYWNYPDNPRFTIPRSL